MFSLGSPKNDSLRTQLAKSQLLSLTLKSSAALEMQQHAITCVHYKIYWVLAYTIKNIHIIKGVRTWIF